MKKYCAMLVFTLLAVTVLAKNTKDLIKEINSSKDRRQVVAEIEKMGDAAIPSLREAAADKNQTQQVRILCITMMGRLKASGAQSELEGYLAKDEDKHAREAAAIALGDLDQKSAVPKLKEALNDASGNVRMRAVWALAKLGDKSGKETALEALKGKDVTAQLLAVEALEAVGDKDIIPQLKNNLKSGNTWTRIHSKLAIKRLEMLGLTGSGRLEYLKSALTDEQYEVNRWAAQELAAIGTTQAIEILKEAMNDAKNPGSSSARKVLQRLVELGKITQEELQR